MELTKKDIKQAYTWAFYLTSYIALNHKEDVNQLALLGMWIGKDTYSLDKASSLRTWCFMCVRREVYDYLRKQSAYSRSKTTIEVCEYIDEIQPDINNPNDDDILNRLTVQNIMKRMPKKEAKILFDNFWSEKSAINIGKSSKCSKSWVSRKRQRALSRASRML